MAWSATHSICDLETARKAAGSCLAGQNILGVTAGSLSSVAVAQAAAITASKAGSVCDLFWGVSVSRGYEVASGLGATFDGSYTDLYASLPSSVNHERNFLQN